MQRNCRSNQRGNALVEFALVSLVIIPLMLGTVFLGFAMGNNIEAVQISRDIAHMYAKGADFSSAQNASRAFKLAKNYDLSSTGNSVVILSQVIKVYQTNCDAAGLSAGQCANLGENVFVNRIVVGNASLKLSSFGTPNPAYLDGRGNLGAADYLTQTGAKATAFSSLLAQRVGAIAYVAEVFLPVPNFNFYGNTNGTPGVFVHSIF